MDTQALIKSVEEGTWLGGAHDNKLSRIELEEYTRRTSFGLGGLLTLSVTPGGGAISGLAGGIGTTTAYYEAQRMRVLSVALHNMHIAGEDGKFDAKELGWIAEDLGIPITNK